MISAQITGIAQTIYRIHTFSPNVRHEVEMELRAIARDLQTHVKRDKLSGQVLKNRSGHLRQGINQRVIVDSQMMTAIVGFDSRALPYGRFWEYGFHGTEEVRSHLRMMKVAWGIPMKEPRQVTVGAFTRKVDQAARSFLRSSLDDMVKEIHERLRAAAARGLAK